MKNNPQIFWSITLIIIVVIIFSFFSIRKNNKSEKISELLKSESAESQALPLGEGQMVTNSYFGDKQYKHMILGFGFSYPDEYTISSFGNFYDSNGETVLLQKADKLQGLQILVTPFDEDTSLTIQRIKKDLPTLSMSEESEIQVGQGDKKVQMVTFRSSNNLTTGKSIEGWFVYNKNLYQISSPEDSKDLFDKVISSWKLEE